MNITIAQPNLTVADFEGNIQKIKTFIQKAYAQGADVIIFPELIVGGYPAFGLYASSDFQQACEAAIADIAQSCKEIACILGSVYKEPTGTAVYNAAYVIQAEKVETIITKKHLRASYIDHEADYFVAGTGARTVVINGVRLCIAIGADAQYLDLDEPFDSIDALVVLNNRPFSYIQHDVRFFHNRILAEKHKLPVLEVAQVGAQGDIIFAGGSMLVSAQGKLIDEADLFQEDLRMYALQGGAMKTLQAANKHDHDPIELIYHALILGIKDFFEKQGFTKAIIGLSGGLDSALVAVLASKALGAENIHCILMPSSFSTDHSVADAKALVSTLGCAHSVLPIQIVFEAFRSTLEPLFKDLPFDVTEENLQARTRGSLLMAVANKFGGIVLNTSNKSEAAMGYGTLYGDLVGSLSVLGDVYKTQAYELAKHINQEQETIPLHIIEKAPSAELRPGQKDSDALPEYARLDPVLFQYVDLGKSVTEIVSGGLDRSFVLSITRVVDRMAFKRHQAPPILAVSSQPFGKGKEIPEVKRTFPKR